MKPLKYELENMNEFDVLKLKMQDDFKNTDHGFIKNKVLFAIITVHQGIDVLSLDKIMKDVEELSVSVQSERESSVLLALIGTGNAGHNDMYDNALISLL